MQFLRKISLLAIVMLAFGVISASAQVNVNPGAGSYTTLKGAFDAINAGTHTGAITVDIVGDTTETAPAVLNASGAGSASYTSITISPSGGAARTISGAIAAGSPLIDFNGADNVTINGLNTGGNTLTIANTTASATSGTSTIRFIGGATSNTITNSNIQGSSSASVATNGGTIFFSTDGVTTNGNDNNTISNNNIGPAGANLPSKAILCNGSTTTLAINNSGISIDNNNIFDYFGAAVTSAGVAVNGGCSGDSITNNRFYQTAARTWTTGSVHSGIFMSNTTSSTSAVQNMTITGNIIGYASNTQTGTYTLTGAGTGAKFAGISYNGISTGTVSNVNNNTVAAVSMTGVTGSGTSTSTPFVGILLIEGNLISNGNTIGSQSATGSLTFSTTTTSATDVYGIFNFSSNAWTTNTNNIGGIAITNLGASGTFLFYALRANTGAVAWNAASNNIGGTVANSISLNATGVASQVVGMQTPNAISTFTSNTIRNLTTNIGTGTTSGASVIGIVLQATQNHTISQNTIFNLSNTNTTAASVVTGIQFTGNTANVVERNFIHSLTAATTSTSAEVNGIRVAGGTTVYRNNMIAIGAGIANAIGAAPTNAGTVGINGINEASGTNQFFHNSVYIGGSPTAGVGSSYAFNGTITTNTRSNRDNIYFNARSNSGATGKNYAIKINGTAANPAGLTINNNVYFANGTGGVFGFFNSLDVANLAAWKTAVGQDAASFESNPQYNDPTNTTPDLHLHPTNPTVAEGNGADVGVTNDFDGQTRASLTPVDIGADAGNFAGIDLAAPNITYTSLANTTTTTNRILTVTITDATGVATGGNAPRIYFRKSTDPSYVSIQCSLTSGTVQNGTWSCLIDYSLVGGGSVTAGDTIQYFVVAQDTLGNLASNPSAGFVGTNVNTITTPPTTPSSYKIATAFTGSINVGSAETYTSLTNTGGLFEAINNNVVTGNLTINITSNLTGEIGTNALNQVAEEGAGAGTYTVLIKPSGAARVISGTGTGSIVIKLNGADRVTIDGSLSGGTDQSLTISNSNTANGTGTLFVGSIGTGQGAANNTIKNCIINAGSIGTTSNFTFAVFVGDTTGASAGADNDNLTIQNNVITKARTGLQAIGTATGVLDNLNINGNVFGDNTPANSIGRIGMTVGVVNNANISNNTVKNILLTGDTSSSVGINLSTSTNSTIGFNTVTGISATGSSIIPQGITAATTTTGLSINGNIVDGVTSSGSVGPQGITVSTGVTNSSVTRNNVRNINYTGTSGYGGKGIEINTGSAASNITVANNFISNINGDDWSAGANILDTTMGLRITGSTGGINVYHNSVNLATGNFTGNSQSGTVSAAFYVASTATALNVRNNVFTNNRNNTTLTNDKNYAFYSDATSTAFTDINYNDYWVPASVSTGPQVLGFIVSDRLLLSDIQTGTTKDANSVSADPLFVSTTDLHTQAGSPLLGAGVSGTGIDIDFDNDLRDTVPDIGADEVVTGGRTGTIPAGTYRDANLGTSTLGGNTTVTGTLTLSGLVTTNGNTLTIDCNGSVSGAGASNFVVGNVQKNFCTTGTFTYPVGDNTGTAEYSPLAVNVTTLGTVGDGLTVAAFDTDSPSNPGIARISRYWQLTRVGTGAFTTDMTFTYPTSEESTITNPADRRIYRSAASACSVVSVCSFSTDGSNTLASITNVSSFSPWTIAQLAPTAASVEVAGRVREMNGRGINRARVMMTDVNGNVRMAFTNQFGYYRFSNVPSGSNYIFSVAHRRYQFAEPTQVQFVSEDTENINFTATGTNNSRPEATFFDNAPFDFDGDGRTDVAVFRQSNNTWYIKLSQSNTLFTQEFGATGDRLVPADFDGDGKTDLAVFRPAEGNWYIWSSASNSLRVENFGADSDRVIPADFDGDGKADLSAWNELRGTWQVKLSTTGAVISERFANGKGNFNLLAFDRDGDGKADFAFFNQLNGTWTIRTSGGANLKEQFGQSGDRAAMGDFDGDGLGDLAVFRQSENAWLIKSSNGGNSSELRLAPSATAPVSGDFDGDGRFDAAGFGNGIWSIRQSVNDSLRQQQFGLADDILIPSNLGN